MIFVSSDDGLGSRSGDVDDAFAVAALLAGSWEVVLASVFGNTSEAQAYRNLHTLRDLMRAPVPVEHGATRRGEAGTPAARELARRKQPMTLVAIGPLTDLASALTLDPTLATRVKECVVVGGNLTSLGRFPPLWPHEFNFTADRKATRAVFSAGMPLTVVPLDVAGRFRLGRRELEAIEGPLGDYLRSGSERWIRRTRFVHLRSEFAVYDLLAALAGLGREGVTCERKLARAHPSGRIVWNEGLEVEVVTGFDHARLVERFLALVNRA